MALDGIQKREGSLIFFDTNRHDKYDSALKRPGRIDHIIEFPNSSKNIIKNLLIKYFNENINDKDLNKVKDNYWTLAEIDSIMDQNQTNLKNCIEILSTDKVDNNVY